VIGRGRPTRKLRKNKIDFEHSDARIAMHFFCRNANKMNEKSFYGAIIARKSRSWHSHEMFYGWCHWLVALMTWTDLSIRKTVQTKALMTLWVQIIYILEVVTLLNLSFAAVGLSFLGFVLAIMVHICPWFCVHCRVTFIRWILLFEVWCKS